MRILWIADAIDGRPDADPASLCQSRMASQRMRIGIPARELRLSGLKFGPEPGPDMRVLDIAAARDATGAAGGAVVSAPDVVVFSKILQRSAAHLEAHVDLARQLAARGSRVVMDICDNPFGQPLSQHMQALIGLAQLVVANSAAMAELIATHAGREARVIADPVEGPRCAPQFAPRARSGGLLRRASGRLKLLWFGASYAYLRPWLARLQAFSRHGIGVDLHLVSAPQPEIEADLGRGGEFAREPATEGLHLRFTPWSLAVMGPALADCDLVFLPSDPADPYRMAASANRLAESLQAGRLVVASGVPSYWEFRDSAWIGDRLEDGLMWALRHPREVLSRIATGQQRIDRHYLPAVVAAAWREALGLPAAKI